MYFKDLNSVINWFNPGNFWIILTTYLIIVTVQFFLYALINNLYLSMLFSFSIFLLFNIVNYYKLQILDQPLFPWDLFLTAQLVDLIPQLTNVINLEYLILGSIVFAASIFLYRFIPKCKLNIKTRIIFITLSTIVLTGFIFNNKGPVAYIFEKLSISNPISTPKTNVTRNGLILSFFLYIPDTFIDKPKDYSQETMESIAKSLDFEESSQEKHNAQTENEKPNIIVIMSESLFDVTNIDGLAFNEEPLPNIKEQQIGSILSPQFGGGTANVEFEALTGLSNVFLPDGSSPYQQYIKKDTPSLASVLSNKGYKATAIHTYYGWYWNREDVYNHLGFQDYISIEDMPDAEIKGQYASDKVITDQIIKQTDENEEPTFIYAITMQNHTPYVEGQYGENTIKIANDLTKETKGMLETYSSGISDSDKELKRLIEHYENSDEPTLIVFFGDHLPSLGSEYSSYIETNFINSANEQDLTLSDKAKMKQTPLVLWSNYKTIEQAKSVLSPSFLAPLIFEAANLEMPKYYKFLKDFSDKLPGYTKTVKVSADNTHSEKTPDRYNDLEKIYELIQYDLLFGKQFSKEILFD